MPNYLTDDAICLRVTDFSETSQIVNLFARTHGILPLIAKGSKRQSKSGAGPFSGPLDLLTAGQIVFIPAKASVELGLLTAWQLTDQRPGLRQSLPALHAALMCVEITQILLHPHDPYPQLFDEFSAALALLAGPNRPRALVAYAKAALTAAGYLPQLTACLDCGAPITPDAAVRFSPAAGGVLCPNCPDPPPPQPRTAVIAVPGRILIALDRLPSPTALLASPPDRPADPAALRTAFNLLLAQIQVLHDAPLKTHWLIATIFPEKA